MKKIETNFRNALLEFNKEKSLKILQDYPDKALVPKIIENVLAQIGCDWESGDISLSEIYMSGQICEHIICDLYDSAPLNNLTNEPIAIVTFNDYHTLGKKIVVSILKSVGIQVLDYGHGLTIDAVIHRVKSDNIKILLISVLMLNSALKIKELRSRLRMEKLDIKILVGGAPFIFDKNLWKEVDADAMGSNPADAIDIINNWHNPT